MTTPRLKRTVPACVRISSGAVPRENGDLTPRIMLGLKTPHDDTVDGLLVKAGTGRRDDVECQRHQTVPPAAAAAPSRT